LHDALCFINGIEMSQTAKACYCTNIWKYVADGLLELSAANKGISYPHKTK